MIKKIFSLLILLVFILESSILTSGQETENSLKTADSTKLLSTEPFINYGLLNKKEIAGNVFVLDSSQFNKGFYISLYDLINGKVPGLIITSNSGRPDDNYIVKNGGPSAIFSNPSPLIVLDDSPILLSNEQIFINTEDIKSFVVIRDATAVALYGERASNGVIIINTKRGSNQFRVNYTNKISYSYLPKQVDVLSGDEIRNIIYDRWGTSDPELIDRLGPSNTNWQSKIYRTTYNLNNSLSLSGSIKTVPFRLSLSKTNQDGILKTSEFNHTTASFSVDPSLLDNHLKIGLNIYGIFNDNQIANESSIRNAIICNPTQQVYLNGKYNINPNHFSTFNPLAALYYSDETKRIKRGIGNLKIDYRLHFFPDLRIVYNYSEDHYKLKDHLNQDTTYIYGGYINYLDETYKSKTHEFVIDYSKQIDAIYSKVRVEIGSSEDQQKINAENYEATYLGSSSLYKSVSHLSFSSKFLRLNYLFKNRYLLNYTLRKYSDSRYPSNSREGISTIASISWDIKNENFLKGARLVSDLRLWATYSKTGGYWQPPLNSGWYNWVDPNLEPESIKTLDFGISYGFFNNRINGSVCYYSKTTENSIAPILVPTGTSFLNYLLTNIGDVESKGFIFSINTNIITGRVWHWEVDLNGTYNKNRVTSLIGDITILYNQAETNLININRQVTAYNKPLNSFYVLKQVYDSKGSPIEGLYVNAPQMYFYQHTDPDLVMGIASILKYKEWELSCSGRFNVGNYVYNKIDANSYYNYINGTFDVSNVSRSVYDSNFSNSQYNSDYYIQNASFFRMDYISLGYYFKNIYQNKIGIHVSTIVQNAFIITKYKGFEPENANGIDGYKYPRSRTFSLVLNFNF